VERTRRLVAGCALALASVACASGSRALTGADDRGPALATTFASMEEMVEACLAALEAEDLQALEQMSISREEFRDVVWPGLEISRSESLPWEFVWSQHELRHRRGLERALALFGGRDLEYAGVEFEGVDEHGTYRLHRSSVVEIVGPDGATRRVRIFASVIEAEGRFKIYSFITD